MKKYEPEQLVNVPGFTYITCYTIGYPSTAYYPNTFQVYFGVKLYPDIWGPPVPNYESGMANYMVSMESPNGNAYTKIYTSMSYTPPYGYVPLENGDTGRYYSYTAIATVYSYNYNVQYGNVIKSWSGGQYYIGREFRYREKQSKIYVSLSISEDMMLNNVVYHPSDEQTIHTIDMSTSGDDYIDIVINLSSKYHSGEFDLEFTDSDGNSIPPETYQGLQLVVNHNLGFSVDNPNSRCIISKYSNTLENVGYIYAAMDGLGYTFDSSGWSNNTLYTESNWTTEGGAPGPSNIKIDHYQSSFKITLDGYTKTIWITTKIGNIRNFG